MNALTLTLVIIIALLIHQAVTIGLIYVFRKQLATSYVRFTLSLIKEIEQEIEQSAREETKETEE